MLRLFTKSIKNKYKLAVNENSGFKEKEYTIQGKIFMKEVMTM